MDGATDRAAVLAVADQLRGHARYLRGINADAAAKREDRLAEQLERACGVREGVARG